MRFEVELLFVFVKLKEKLESEGLTFSITGNGIEVDSLEPKSTEDNAKLLHLQLPRCPKDFIHSNRQKRS